MTSSPMRCSWWSGVHDRVTEPHLAYNSLDDSCRASRAEAGVPKLPFRKTGALSTAAWAQRQLSCCGNPKSRLITQ